MDHDTPLIATIVAGLTLAFAFGALAHRLKISPLAGYLLAGVMVGPFTPGFVADQKLAMELAEIGVILLMFGVGLHFSLKDLMSVKAIAIPGAIVQIGVATALGWGLGTLLGWPPAAGIIFGLALSVASTVVLLRALQEKRIVQTARGRIAVGWLVVEDLVMVLALVLIPSIAGLVGDGPAPPLDEFAMTLGLTLGKVGLFVAVMLIGGRRLVPMLLHAVAHTGSRELFRLAVLVVALGIAFGAAKLFDVSFALGAFFAGMVLAESELSQRATEETMPLRDAFAVLFFVSVGMLFDPNILVTSPLSVVAAVLIVVFGKSIAAFLIVRLFGHPTGTALTISASLAQIGEFSFILANLGVAYGLLSEEGRGLVLAAAMISILVNPFIFSLAERIRTRLERPAVQAAAKAAAAAAERKEESDLRLSEQTGHAIVVGFGRVGHVLVEQIGLLKHDLVLIEEADHRARPARALGLETIIGNAVREEVLNAANVRGARILFVAVPDGFDSGQVVQQAKALNPGIRIIARAHSDEERDHLKRLGADEIVVGEREIGLAMVALSGDAMEPSPAQERSPS
jgi:CPA2 family monovalent cation:H+ antiporter-2